MLPNHSIVIGQEKLLLHTIPTVLVACDWLRETAFS